MIIAEQRDGLEVLVKLALAQESLHCISVQSKQHHWLLLAQSVLLHASWASARQTACTLSDMRPQTS